VLELKQRVQASQLHAKKLENDLSLKSLAVQQLKDYLDGA